MLYINNNNINKIGINWTDTIDVIERAIKIIDNNDYAQPLKPYLRYKDLKNRIIAMPSYIGGDFSLAGIKWIASFPDNIKKNIPRAHSVIILNNAETGIPFSIINTSLISIIRTVSVTGVILKWINKVKQFDKINIGIIGFGPIGKYHYKMCNDLLGDKISNTLLYDIRNIDKDINDFDYKGKIILCNSWEELYLNSDIIINCTVSQKRYIDKKPKEGAILLNISLRDYKSMIFNYVNMFIVDDWTEVCRENTDIEMMHMEKNLNESDVINIQDFIFKEKYKQILKDDIIMFNPMGLGVFDLAISQYYYNFALKRNIGIHLK